MTDNVRIRVAGENAYTIAVLPDTQDCTNAQRAPIFNNMTNWLVNNKESLNLQFVIHVGDITTTNNHANHWVHAEPALRVLDGKIPYSLLPGNPDQNTGNAGNHSTNPLDTRFSPTKQAATNPGAFGGVYDRELIRSANDFHSFTAPDGTKWRVLSLEFGPRDDVLRRAGDALDGGAGIDTADFSDDTAGVTVDLSAGTAEGDKAGFDTLVSIENVTGGSGNDVFDGGAGSDILAGGSGHDVFVFAAGFGKGTITDILEFSIGLFADFSAAKQIGADTVFSIEAETTLTLKGVDLANLAADDFRFV